MPSGKWQKQAKILSKEKCYPGYQNSPLNNLLHDDQHIEENEVHKETRHP